MRPSRKRTSRTIHRVGLLCSALTFATIGGVGIGAAVAATPDALVPAAQIERTGTEVTATNPGTTASRARPLADAGISTGGFTGLGGTAVFRAVVRDARACTFTASPPLGGFAAKVPCRNGAISRKVKVPANPSGRDRTYVLDLAVRGPRGTAHRSFVIREQGSIGRQAIRAPRIDVDELRPISRGGAGGAGESVSVRYRVDPYGPSAVTYLSLSVDGANVGQSNPLTVGSSPVTLMSQWTGLSSATSFTLTFSASNGSGTTSLSRTFTTGQAGLQCPGSNGTFVTDDGLSVPSQVCYGNGVPYSSYGNNVWGDCELAAAANLEQTWSGEAGGSVAPLDQSGLIAEYEQMSGATPSNPSVGLANSQLFQRWSGAGILGTSIAPGTASLPTANEGAVENAIWQFGGIYASVDLPSTDASIPANTEWNLGNSSGATSGHAVAVVGYDRSDLFVVTWGRIQAVSWQWWSQYATAAYAVLPDQFVASGQGPVSSVTALEGLLDP